ncbi:MAG: hypothetical protein V4515_03495 [Chloroflexota bacterium]
MNDEDPGTEELARRLEAYASARLAPNRLAMGQMRSNLIDEARIRTLEATLSRGTRRHRVRRRIAAVALAAVLTAGGAATVAAATTAGGPLYQARIWLETAALSMDADTRALERLHQIDARVLELERAATAGDQNGITAAIDAYRDAVAAAVAEIGNYGDRLKSLKAALGLHLVVLQTLSERVPKPAMDAIKHAIEASHRAVERIDASSPDPVKPGVGHPDKPAATPKASKSTESSVEPREIAPPSQDSSPDASRPPEASDQVLEDTLKEELSPLPSRSPAH